MSLDETIFVGQHDPDQTPLPYHDILEHHALIRDAIATTGYTEPNDLKSTVMRASFVYAFNTYKAIGLLLPELYHESSAVILRQLWEVSLNLHWIALDPTIRAQDFCNFTVVEHRKVVEMSKDPSQLKDFDDVTDRFQSKFHYRDGRNRKRVRSNFAATNIHDRANELGEPWKGEYKLLYAIASSHAHATPGAVLHAIFQQYYPNPEIQERNTVSLMAILAAEIMVRDVQLLARIKVIPESSSVTDAFDALQNTINEKSSDKPESDGP